MTNYHYPNIYYPFLYYIKYIKLYITADKYHTKGKLHYTNTVNIYIESYPHKCLLCLLMRDSGS